jgi:hypothetical protein
MKGVQKVQITNLALTEAERDDFMKACNITRRSAMSFVGWATMKLVEDILKDVSSEVQE